MVCAPIQWNMRRSNFELLRKKKKVTLRAVTIIPLRQFPRYKLQMLQHPC